MSQIKQAVRVDKQVKLAKLGKIVAAIKRDKAKGKKLFFCGHPENAAYDYYRSERSAKKATKQEMPIYDGEGCLVRNETVCADIDEIALDGILDSLAHQRNPFADLYHSSSAYPYRWLQAVEDLFIADLENPLAGWNDTLFPKAGQERRG